MIHSLSGGVLTQYDNLIYVFVLIKGGLSDGEKRWYKSPFRSIKVGDGVRVPVNCGAEAEGEVLRVENVTAQTAPYPVRRTMEIIAILPRL